MLWPHKIFLCGIVATWHGWPAYACSRRIVGLRRANHGRRLEAEDAAVWKPLPQPVLRSSATTHTAGLG
jgi:hypothetical protein